MAKPLIFEFAGDQLLFETQKVDRDKLYGFKELEVLDDEERKCDLATLAEDGKSLIGRGGTGIGYLTADGNWCEKSELTPVDLEGNEITPVPSTFSAPVQLDLETSTEDYLNHNIRLIYRMKVKQDSPSEEKLFNKLRAGAIFKFPYSFRGGLEADAGFLLMNDQQELFFLVGDPTVVDYIGLQTAPISPDDDGQESSDAIDFGMM